MRKGLGGRRNARLHMAGTYNGGPRLPSRRAKTYGDTGPEVDTVLTKTRRRPVAGKVGAQTTVAQGWGPMSSLRRRFAAATACFFAATFAAASPSAADSAWPVRVVASYKVQLAGLEFGTFNFSSNVSGQTYNLVGETKLAWGMGLFRWQGAARSTGTLSSKPSPGAYNLEFKSNSKSGLVRLGFKDHDVISTRIEPETEPSPENVPVRPQHLKDVFDPLSALLAVAHGGLASPCGRRIALFDGKHRFDLVLSFRRQVKITEAKPSGEPGIGFVCRVQYIPISGHKDNKATHDLAANQGIEVTLRPVPSANLLVPYQVVIPTVVGHAVLQSKVVEITTSAERRIALIH